MPEHPQWAVGDRNPAITDTVSINGVGVDISAKTVTFKMRAFNSTTLKVNQPVTTKLASGVWTYGWGASDLDTAGQYLVWVTVDMGGGALETVNEAPITVYAHAPETNAYLELEEFKATAELSSNYADPEIRLAIVAASRGLDLCLGRRFYPDPDATQIRYYTPESSSVLYTDDIITLTELATDSLGGTTFGTVWTLNTDFTLEPLNSVADGKPFYKLCRKSTSANYFPPYARSVRVTGKFGWAVAPPAIRTATSILASRLLKRTRESPFGLVQLGLDGAVIRASQLARDPELEFLTGYYSLKVA